MKVLHTSLLGAIPVAAASMAILAASPSQAAIIGTTNNVIIHQNPSFSLMFFFSETRPANLLSTSLQGFQEKQGVTLGTNINVNNPDRWYETLNIIPAGTRINSDYFFFMPPACGQHCGTRLKDGTARLTFNGTILGVIGHGIDLLATNPLLGLSTVTYHSYSNVALDSNYLPNGQRGPTDDYATYSGNTLDISITSSNALDVFRVITAVPVEAIPEPLTILGAATATGFGAFFKRELAKRKKKDDA